MTLSTRTLTLTLLLILSLTLAACASAPTETQPAREEPAPTSEPASPTLAPQAEPTDESALVEAQPTAEPAPAQDGAVSFQNDILPIMENSCVRCHGGNRTEKGLDLSSYAALMAGSRNGAMVLPGNADGSEMVIQVVSGEMPRRAAKLSDEAIQLIIDWVNQGALDN